jgi:hypothetical protein
MRYAGDDLANTVSQLNNARSCTRFKNVAIDGTTRAGTALYIDREIPAAEKTPDIKDPG